MDFYTDAELRPQLQRLVEGFATLTVAAHILGIDKGLLSRALSGKRPVGATLAKALGYERVHAYQRARQAGRPRKESIDE